VTVDSFLSNIVLGRTIDLLLLFFFTKVLTEIVY
jgi:hypothetical protein